MSTFTSQGGVTLRTQGLGRSLLRIFAVAGNTLREAGRNRLFYGLLGAAALLLVFSVLLSDLALLDQKARLVQDFGLFIIPLLDVASAVLMGALLLYKEIDRKTLYAILPKPIRRSEFLLGKLLGLCGLLALQELALALCWYGVLKLRGGDMTPAIGIALLLSYIEVVFITSVALFFSALSRPVLSGVLTVGVFLIGRVSYVLADLLGAQKSIFSEVPAMHAVGRVLLTVVPDLSTFNVADEVLLGWDVPLHYVTAAAAYGLSWSALFTVAALLVFERRDIV